jgi:hypothetical protein
MRIAALGLLLVGGTACVEDLVEPPPPPKESEVFHYWHFNTLPEGTLTSVPSDASKVSGAVITYPGTGAGYMDRVDPGSDINADPGQPAGFGLRPRNPSNTRELLIVAPSTGYGKLIVTYALQRSSSGAAQEIFEYSVDGTSWLPVGSAFDVGIDWTKVTIDLSAIDAVSNKPGLRLRIRFVGTGADGTSGNHRLDNFKIEGVPQ